MNDMGTIVEWAKSVGFVDDPKQMTELANSVQDTDGVFFIPAFNGLQVSLWNLGLSSETLFCPFYAGSYERYNSVGRFYWGESVNFSGAPCEGTAGEHRLPSLSAHQCYEERGELPTQLD